MDTATVTYLGDLQCELEHLRSGQVIATDAPVDNKGKGGAFSPTDLLATSLAACMITTMGIVAREKGIPLNGLRARVVKHMAPPPRRVARVEIHMELDGRGLDDRQRTIMEQTARTCPVALSLSAELIQDIQIRFT
ncbi:MAG: OsmC family protein [Flavobacteriales bacterium]